MPQKKIKKLEAENAHLQRHLNIAEIRLSLAQAWADLLDFAYDQLLYHGIDFKKLPEYQDSKVLEQSKDLGILSARGRIITWIGKVRNGVKAAARRKGIKLI